MRSLVIIAVGFLATPAAAQSVDRWSGHITEASARFGIPQQWIRRVMRSESGGRTMLNGRPITSRAGAMGLMQLMPGTWGEMRAAHGLGTNPHNPRDNIVAGTAYLRAMYDRFGYPGVFAAYNAGPARYAKHLTTGQRLPAETIAYVAAVGGTSVARSVAPMIKSASVGVGAPAVLSAVPSENSGYIGVFAALVRDWTLHLEAAPPHSPSNPRSVRLSTASAPSH